MWVLTKTERPGNSIPIGCYESKEDAQRQKELLSEPTVFNELLPDSKRPIYMIHEVGSPTEPEVRVCCFVDGEPLFDIGRIWVKDIKKYAVNCLLLSSTDECDELIDNLITKATREHYPYAEHGRTLHFTVYQGKNVLEEFSLVVKLSLDVSERRKI